MFSCIYYFLSYFSRKLRHLGQIFKPEGGSGQFFEALSHMGVVIFYHSLKEAETAFGQLLGPMAEKGNLGFLQTFVKNDRLQVKEHLGKRSGLALQAKNLS